jgi:UDP-glucose 4-epimerase
MAIIGGYTLSKLLVTGGAGYIGSHVVVELLNSGHEVVVLDNLCNSSTIALDRVESITGKSVTFVKGDIRDRERLNKLFAEQIFDGVVHFAGLKAVGESVEQPLAYYNNNVFGSLQLLQAMADANVKTIVFSSSATVYGDPVELPLNEEMPTGKPTNPYGMSKLIIENILEDLYRADSAWRIARLRYFNPVGAHESGFIGENPSGMPNNLMPLICQVAAGVKEKLLVYGNDFPTFDGSGVRDYIHVVDLAKGHLVALERLFQSSGMITVNLGTGIGHSVFQMIETFEFINNVKVPYEIVGRRAGDVASCYADPAYAKECLGWCARLKLDDMCRDAWTWASKN